MDLNGIYIIINILQTKQAEVLHTKIMVLLNFVRHFPCKYLKIYSYAIKLCVRSIGVAESFCLLGGLPVLSHIIQNHRTSALKLEASVFIGYCCNDPTSLKMFVAAEGTRLLIILLNEEESDISFETIASISAILTMNVDSSHNLCRIFVQLGIVPALMEVFSHVSSQQTAKDSIISVRAALIIYQIARLSQSDLAIRKAIKSRKSLRRAYFMLILSLAESFR